MLLLLNNYVFPTEVIYFVVSSSSIFLFGWSS